MYQYSLQDLDMNELQDVARRLTTALRADPTFQDVDNDLRLTTPTVAVEIDRDRAAALSVTPEEIETALGASFGGEQMSQIYAATDQYQVILELLPQLVKPFCAEFLELLLVWPLNILTRASIILNPANLMKQSQCLINLSI